MMLICYIIPEDNTAKHKLGYPVTVNIIW